MPSRYIAFSGRDYYPCGGAKDITNTGNDLAVLIQEMKSLEKVDRQLSADGFWWHIYDTQENGIVASYLDQ